ncbi:Ig-like domain-containing protein [Limnohabitans sp. 63ED37-2]|uniref:Ig-like domain-containing protein n=1 Tax=Limnohabitans sp. 63ED37-2 TaxID=1678128 RepID=UPI000705E001|nr:Ig-like domain-containing protein [Limnohabitans sp. 63ED37-2]ALK89388.1 FG-GAP repeat protein [Limnohabitans sp. 63ED37-2]
MSKKFKIVVNTGNADNNQSVDVTQGQGGRGQPVRLKAKAGAKYQLLDLEKAKAVGPDYVKVKRVGKNLHILFEGSTEADVIIEDYYDVMPEGYNGVVGQAENGNFYEYIPEDPDAKGLIPQLADGGQAVSVALGGAEVVGSGAALAVLAFNPLLAGLGLLGAGAAAAAVAGGAGGTTASEDVTITAVADNVGNTDNASVNLSAGGLTNDNTPTLTGLAPAGSVVTIRDGEAVLGTTTADANGVWSFTPATLAEGNHSFTATAEVAGSPATSAAFAIVIDTVTPTVAVSVPKTSLATGESVTVTFTLSEASADFVLGDITAVGGTLSNLQGSGTSYTATFTPNAGITSAMVFVDSDKFRDAAGNLNKDGAEANNTVSFNVGTGSATNNALAITSVTDNAANTPEGAAINIAAGGLTNDSTPTVNGTAPAGSVVTLRDGATVLGTTTANAQGVWSFTPSALPEGARSLSASTTVNGATTNAGPFAFTVDTNAPTIAVSVDKTILANGETATLSFTLSEPSADFQASDITSPSGAITNLQGVPGTGNASTGFTQYTATFTPNAGVTSAAIVVSSDRFSDAAGNLNKDGAEINNAVSLAINNANTLVSIDNATDNVGNPNNALQNLTNGASTNDTTPTLNGKAPPGTPVTIRDGNTVLGTATADANGNWSFTTPTLTQGSRSLVASFVANGVTNTSNPYTLVIDTTAPTIQVSADQTRLLNAGDTATVFFDLSEPSTDLTNADITLSGGTLSTLQGVPGTGNATTGFTRYTATFTKTTGSTTSVAVASARFSDAAGNVNADGADANNTWTFSATPATATSIGSVTDNAGNSNNAVESLNNGGKTNDNTPTLNGRGTPGEQVTIRDGNTILGTTTVNPDGSWSFTPSPALSEGPHSFTATTPSGGTSAPFNVDIDTIAPTAPGIGDLTDNVGAATGSIANNTSTDDTTPTLSGTAEAGSTVRIFDTINGVTTQIGTATADANGAWSFTPVTALANGAHSLTAKAVDAAGNEGPASPARNFTVAADASPTAPAAPAITSVTDNVGSVTGNIAKGTTSDDNTPTVNGTGTPGTVVTVFNGTTPVGTATVGTNGQWSVTTSALTGPAISLSATTTDAAGNTSAPTGAYPYTLDTAAPAKPSFAATDNVGPTTGAIAGGSTTDDTTPTFSGTTEPGAVVVIRDGETVLGTTTARPDGTWSITPTEPLSNGPHNITQTVTDPAGNSSTSDPLSFTVDASAVIVSITKAVDNVAANTGDVADNGVTNDTTPTLVGKATANAVVTLREGTTVLGTTTADANGNWSFTTPVQSSGERNFSASATNAAGTSGTANFKLTIDASAPSVPSGLSVNDDVGTVQGSVPNGGTTDDTTPTISGSAEAGSVVTIRDGETVLGTTTVRPDGTWSFTPTQALAAGPHSITSTATDPAGNTGPASTAQTFTIDTTAPSTRVDITGITNDTGVSSTDFITSDNNGLTVSATLSAPLATGEKLFYSRDNGATWIDITASVNGTAVSAVDSQLTSTATIRMQVRDAAGNAGPTDSQLVTIDASGSNNSNSNGSTSTDPNTAATVSITAISTDTGTSTSDFITSDQTLSYSGTVSGFTANGAAVQLVLTDASGIEVGRTFVTPAANGSWTWDNTGVTRASGNYTLTATVVDAAGNRTNTAAAGQDTQLVTVDTTAPSQETTDPLNPSAAAGKASITLDPVTADNIVNATESAQANVAITGTARGEFTAGDVVTLTVNGKTFTGSVNAQGAFSINVPGADLLADSDKTVAASLAAKDAAGNTGTVTDTQVYTTDTTSPFTTVDITRISLDTGASNSDFTTSDNNGLTIGATLSTALATGEKLFYSKDNGSTWTDITGSVNGTAVSHVDSTLTSTTTIRMQVRDAAGNAGATDSQLVTIDTSAPTQENTTPLTPDAAAGKASVTLAPITADNIVNSVEGAQASVAITGTARGDFTAGDVVTLAVNGKTFTGSVNAQGAFSINVPGTDLRDAGTKTVTASLAATDLAGNTGTITDTQDYTVDTTAPTTTVNITAITNDTGVSGSDFITNDNDGLTISATLSAALATGEKLFYSRDNGATWIDITTSVSGTIVSARDDQLTSTATILMQVRDAAGNPGISDSQLVTIDTTAPTEEGATPLTPTAGKTSLILDDVTADNTVSGVEGAQTNVAITGTARGDFTAGDVVTLTINGKTFTGEVATNGRFSINVRGADLLADGDKTITATLDAHDAAGNFAPISATKTYLTDTIAPNDGAAPTVSITTDSNNDGLVSRSEIGQSNTFTVRASFDKTKVEAGDKVIFNDGSMTETVTLSATDIINGFASITFGKPAEGGTLTVTAQLQDKVGNNGAVSASDSARLDTTGPAPVVSPESIINPPAGKASLSIDNVTADNIVNLAESALTNVAITGTARGEFKAGDTVTLTVNGRNFSGTVNASGQYSINVSGADLKADGDKTIDATLTATDAAGNTGAITANKLYTLDDNTPNGGAAPTVEITTDANNDGLVSSNELGSSQNFAVKGSFDKTKVVAGDLLVFSNGTTTNTINLTQADIDAGFATTTFAKPAEGAALTVTAVVRDIAGNTSASSTADSATLDTTGPAQESTNPTSPAAGKTSLVLNDVTADNILSAAESGTTIAITGTARGEFKAGDTVTLTINSKTFTGTLVTGGTFSINVPGADLAADSDTVIDASLLATDAAGNTGTITATKDYSANTSAPNGGDAPTLTIDTDANNDGLVSFGEIGNSSGTPNTTLTVSAKFDSAKVAVGDTVTFTDTGTGTVKTVTLTQAMKDAGKASTTFTSPGDGATFNVKASLTDGVLGNTGPEATDSAKLDLSNLDPVSPSTKQGVGIRITTDTDDNGILNTTEINGATTASVTVTLPTDAKAGDVLVITGTGNDSKTITLSAAQISAGNLTASFTLPANGSQLEVSARVADTAGNTSNLATDAATVNTTPVGAPTVEITTDSNNDGFINRTELGGATTVSIKTTLPSGAVVGDTITVTDGSTTKTHTLVQADLDAGFVTDSFSAPANDATLNISATRTNSAGNVSSAGTDKAIVDTSSFADPTDATKTGLKVTLGTDTNNDGFISGSELTSQFKATIALPAQAAAGDTITLKASGNNPRSITLTAAHITAGKVEVTDLTATGDGTTFTVSASITDRAGNTSPTPDASDSANIQSAAPNGGVAPTVTITTDDDNNGFVNATEIGTATTFTVKGSFDNTKVMAGDQIVFSDGSNTQTITLSAADIGNGFATTTFAKPAEGGTLTVNAKLQDSLGNSTASSANDSAKLDTSAPNGEAAPVVSITTDANNDGFVSAAELGSATTFTARATFDKTKVVAGDILVFTNGAIVKMVTLTATDISNGFGTTTFDKPAEGATLQVSATVMDTAGNVASESNVDSAQLDTTGPAQETANPGNPAVGKASLTLDKVTADNVLNAAESAQSAIAITGKVRGEFTTGDTVTLRVNNTDFTGQVAADGTFSINVSGANLLADSDLTVAASLVANDKAGNPGTITANQAYTLDSIAPNGSAAPTVTITTDANNDGLVNASEIGTANTFAVRANFDKTKVTVGDKVLFSDGTTTNTVTLAQADLDAGFATTTYAKPSEGATLSVTAKLQDPEGNNSATSTADSAKLDTTGPLPVVNPEDPLNPPSGKTSLVLDSVTADNIVNTVEGAQASIAITGTVRGEFTTGDVVTLTINGKTFTGAVAANGRFSINTTGADLLADNDTTVAASLAAKDAAGNTGTITDDQVYSTDATAPTTTVDITGITDDTGVSNSDFITSDNNGLTIRATLSAALATGEKLFYSKHNGTTWIDITTSVSGTNVSAVDTSLTSTATIQMQVRDESGNAGVSDSQLVTIDTSGSNNSNSNGGDSADPNASSSTSVSIDAISTDSGTSTIDFITNDPTLTYSGTVSNFTANGDAVKLVLKDASGTEVGSTFVTPASNGTWSWDNTGVTRASGNYTLSATIVDKAGNTVTGAGTDSQIVTIDTDGGKNTDNSNGSATPQTDANKDATVSITGISLDSGTSASDFVTNDQTLVYNGTVGSFTANGDVVQLELKNAAGTVVGSTFVTPASNGTWSWSDTGVTRDSGNYTLIATIVDKAGNRTNTAAAGTDSQIVTVDNSATQGTDNSNGSNTPATDANTNASIAIASIVDSTLASSDTGTSANDFITQDRSLAIKGTVTDFVSTGNATGAAVRVQILKADNTVAAEGLVTPDSSGNWTFNNTVNDLIDGAYTVKASIVDLAGNAVKAATDKTLIIDNSASTNPANNPATDGNSGSTVSVSVTAIDDGNSATGNANGSKDNGTSATDFVTNDNTLVIKGTTANFSSTGGASGDRVRVQLLKADGTLQAEAFVQPDTNGAWSWDRTGIQQADGKYTLKADIVDAAGNVVKAGNSQALVIDTDAANNPNNGTGAAGSDSNATSTLTLAITSIVDSGANDSKDTGVSATDFITNDQTLVIKGTAAGFSNTGAQAGDQLRVQIVKADGSLAASQFVTVDGSGNWALDNHANTLAEGTYTLKADVVDLAGNVVKSTTKTLKVDTTNAEQVDALNINKDTPSSAGTSNTDWKIFSDGTTKGQTIFGTVGTGEALSKVEISTDGGTTWAAGDLSGDLVKFYLDTPLSTGTKTFQFRTTDLAGNVSSGSTQQLVVEALATTSTSGITLVADGATQVLPSTSTGISFAGAGAPGSGSGGAQTFELSASAIANYLVNATPSANWVNAGAGIDTLKVTGTGTTLDLNNLTDFYTTTKLQGFEIIDLESDSGAQNVIGDATAFASFGTASWLTNINLLSNYQLVVRGNTGDKLVLSAGDGYDTTGWVKGAKDLPFATDPANSNASVSDGRTYTRWSNASLKIDLLVDNDIETSNKFVSFNSISTDTGSSASDLITTDTTLSLSGATSGLATGEVVKVTVLNSSNVKVVDNVTATVTNGVWTLDNQANALALGNYTVKTNIVSSGGATLATGQDRIVQVIAANDTPVNNGLTAQSTNEDTALAITGLSMTDATNNGDNYTVTLGVTNGVLNVSGGTATITGSGTNTVTLTGTKAAINATLATTVSFAPTANFSGSAQLTMTTNDGSLGDAKTDTDTITITVNSVNDAPVVVTSATARSYTENAAGVAANDTLTLSDADSANLTGATVQITSGRTTGDVLSFTNANGITGSFDAASGKLTLSGTATVAQYQAALQSVTYSSTSDNPTATSGSRTLSWQVNDGQSANNASNVGTSTINLTAVNDAPAISASISYRGLEDAAAPVNGTTTGTLISSLTAGKDADNTNVGIAITGPLQTTTNGTAFYSLDGGATWLDLTAKCASCSATNAFLLDGNARLWFSGKADFSGQLSKANIRLWDGTDGSTTGTFKDISALTGAGDAYSTASTFNLNFDITDINDAPTLVVTTQGGSQSIGSSTAVTAFSAATATLGNRDTVQTIKALKFTVSGLQDGADEKITLDGSTFSLTNGTSGTTTTNGIAFSVSVTNGTATVDLSSSAGLSTANTEILVKSIQYINTNATASLGGRVLTISSLQDTGGTANGGVDTATLSLASTITVVAANAAPVLADVSLSMNSLPSSATPANPTGAVGTLVSDFVGAVTDANSTNGKGIAINAIDTSKGSLFFSTNGGTTWTAVDTSTALSDSRAFLLKSDTDNRVYFKPNANFTGSISSAFTFRAWDQTSGTEGAFVNISATNAKGGTTAYSLATDTVNQTVTTSVVTLTNGIVGVASATTGYNTGSSVSYLGDVNGDGYDDFVIGQHPNFSPSDARAFVVFGSSTPITSLELSSITAGGSSNGFVIRTDRGSSKLGINVSAAGDMNGDGLADILVADTNAQATNGGNTSAVFVVYGKTNSNTVTVDTFRATATSEGYAILGRQSSIVNTAGDLNGDGLNDILSAGSTSSVLFGTEPNASTGINASYDLGSPPTGAFDYGFNTSNVGYASNAGDVNGDGFGDFVFGNNLADINGQTRAGSARVSFGGTSTAASTTGFDIVGFTANQNVGQSVSGVGDVNGDGLADVVVHDIIASGQGGNSYVVFGKTDTATVNLTSLTAANASGGFMIKGTTGTGNTSTEFLSGLSASYAGDINGDGLADMLLASGLSGPNGRVFVVYGKTSTTALNFSDIAQGSGGFVINGASADDQLGGIAFNDGSAVSYGGDINGDGFDDLLVGAPSAEPSSGSITNVGRTYVIYGGTQFATGMVANGTGGAGSEQVIGTTGNDTLTGGGGVDRFNAGRGNDVIVLTASDVTNLANNTSAAVKAMVDGGQGFDTIRLMNGGTLDLTTIRNVSASAYDGASRINSIERINMGQDVAANTLIIASRDVNDMAGFNSIHTGTPSDDGKTWTNVTGTALSATTRFHQFLVDGTNVDAVSLKSGTGTWTNAGTVKDGATEYVVWQNTATKSQVIVNKLVTVTANVAPVLLDLNRDGTIGYASTVMDVNSDGTLDATHWAAPQDGVLVWDKYADGMVHDHSQFAFAQNGGTDLQGLAEVFDTNHDGQLNEADAKFAEFKVWQDANGNGVSDAGEVRSLADLGITSIDLTSDGTTRTPVAGVTEAGRSTAQLADGSSVLVADAAFEYRSASAAEAASHAVGQGDNVFKLFGGLSLDLSAVTDAAKLTEVNASADAAANTIKLTLTDMLGASGVDAVSGDMHQLMLTGDANDTALLSANEWLSTDSTVTQNGRTYAVYNAANDTTAQLLLDQQMAVTHNG